MLFHLKVGIRSVFIVREPARLFHLKVRVCSILSASEHARCDQRLFVMDLLLDTLSDIRTT